MKLFLKFWGWYKAISKLNRIRKLTSKYFNDSRFVKITEIIDE